MYLFLCESFSIVLTAAMVTYYELRKIVVDTDRKKTSGHHNDGC